MGILDRLGLRRRKARPVGTQLESGRTDESLFPYSNTVVKGGIFLILLVLTILAFPRGDVYEYTAQVGDVWRQATLVAPFNFPIYKDEETLEEERQEVRRNTPPYFRELPDTRERITANRDSISSQLDQIMEAFVDYRRNLQEGNEQQASRDSALHYELRRQAWPKLTSDQWDVLVRDYAARVPGIDIDAERAPVAQRLDHVLLQSSWEFALQLISVGVMDEPRSNILADDIIIRNEEERVDRSQSKNNVYGLNEAHEAARDHFESEFDRATHANMANNFFRALFQPSLQYMRAETVRDWQRREAAISPTRDAVQEGEIIVRNEQRITPEIRQQLLSLQRVHNERQGQTILWQQISGELILSFATYLIFFLYLFFLRREAFDDNRTIFLIALLFAGVIGLFGLAMRISAVSLYIVPVAIASVQLTIMFDSRIGIFGTMTLALIGGLIMGMDLLFFLATLFAGTLGVFSVRDIKNRGQYFLSGAVVLVGYAVIIGAGWLLFNIPSDRIVADLGMVALNSLFVIFAYPLLWVFERSFDLTTDLTLLELSDTNRKLLKELSLRAPGSFNHTLQVANLAEAGADAIGANTLLVRVGALYHDIGKMLKPEYFVENQRTGVNPHDKLKPRMSALIIASHVKEGLELGREHNLPHSVLEFIPMHHGTTRIEYFYQKAVEATEGIDREVMESEFRYPGPRPNSRETGILMLSDAVEAASRSLDDPTHKRLDSLIETVFEARIDDGQLDDTDLTFRDLQTIKDTFLSMLLGIYHVRVKYPDQQEEEKSSETDTEVEAVADADRKMPDDVAEDIRSENVIGTPEQSMKVGGEEESEEDASSEEVTKEAGSSSNDRADENIKVSGNGASKKPEKPEARGDVQEES